MCEWNPNQTSEQCQDDSHPPGDRDSVRWFGFRDFGEVHKGCCARMRRTEVRVRITPVPLINGVFQFELHISSGNFIPRFFEVSGCAGNEVFQLLFVVFRISPGGI